jgi:cytoskeletal protein RodZ
MGQQRKAHSAASRSHHTSRGGKHRAEPRRTDIDGWLVAGAIALGVGAAMTTGSGQAHADTADSGASASSTHHKNQDVGSTPKRAASAGATAHPAHPSASSPIGAARTVADRSSTPTPRAVVASEAAPPSVAATKPVAALAVPSSSAKAAASTMLSLVERDVRQTVQTGTGLIDGLIGVLGGKKPTPAADSGQASVATTAASPTESSTTGSATVPLQVFSDTEPVVKLSVNGGPKVPVLVDTGSEGLVVPLQDIGLATLSWPTGIGISSYSGGITYLYITIKTKVNFGNGIVTKPTPVDVELLSWPGSFESFAADDGSAGVLGIGPNASGPGPSSVITALPGDLSDGVLIDEPDGVLEFGPNPLPARTSVTGAPITDLKVKVGNGPLETVPAIIDSGGVYGTIPSSISHGVPAGTVISVYAEDGQTLLYTYITDGTNTPDVTSDDLLNTGYEPFAQQPVYISYSPKGVGTTTFDYL